MATYEEILAEIQKSRAELDSDSIKIQEQSPAYEALVGAYAPELAKLGTTAIPQKGALLPEVAGQTDLQREALEMQARQAGLLGANESMVFNSKTNTFELPKGASGVAGYQQFLDNAAAAAAGQQSLMFNPDGTLADPRGQKLRSCSGFAKIRSAKSNHKTNQNTGFPRVPCGPVGL